MDELIIKIKQILLSNSLFLKGFDIFQNRTRRVFIENKLLFIDKKGIEIGGPSKVFKETGAFPIYNVIKNLDNINYSSETFWSSIEEGNNYCFQDSKEHGRQIIADAVDLSKISNDSYDFMLASHIIEHVANPLKALLEWKRILKKNGILVIIAPDMRRTYDRKRALTKFAIIFNRNFIIINV